MNTRISLYPALQLETNFVAVFENYNLETKLADEIDKLFDME